MTEVVTSVAASQQLNLLAPKQQVFAVDRQGVDAGFASAETATTAVDSTAEEFPQFSERQSDENPVNKHKDEVAPRREPISGPSKPRIEIKHIDLGLTPSEVVGTPDILQRFDANGDGRVDLIEAARAGVAREGVFTFAGVGGAQQTEEAAEPIAVEPAPVELPATPALGTEGVAFEAANKKMFATADVAGATRKFAATTTAAQGIASDVVDAPKRFSGQGAEVVVGKFAAAETQPKFVEDAKPKVVLTEDGGETKIHDKVAQTDTDQTQGKTGGETAERPAKKLVLVEVAAYADASTITTPEAAAQAVTA